MADQGTNTDTVIKCPYCKKPLDDKHLQYGEGGSHEGNRGILGNNIMSDLTKHSFYIGPGSIEAHHLICSESMRKGKGWKALCWIYGYNINCKENGVFLPNLMSMACQLRVPLHRGGHSAGGRANIAYPELVKQPISSVKEDISDCSEINKEKLINDLNKISQDIFRKVKAFYWIITYDGYNYHWANLVGWGNFEFMSDVQDAVKEIAKAPTGVATFIGTKYKA